MAVTRIVVCSLISLLLLPYSLGAQTGNMQRESVQRFVQAFYDWYVPLALRDASVPAAKLALKQRRHDFSSELASALSTDIAAQSKASEIVGIDFDPLLNSQDPCERYKVSGVIRKGSSYLVSVNAVCSGKEQDAPDVIVELVLRSNHWEFFNFHYPDQLRQSPKCADLLSILKQLRRSRQNPHR